jgi:uncharacterized membrane protein/nitrite reductase/ring-hydroxylating ferredoxin subunit
MRSKAHIKGHPLHPILVSFPIALLTGAFLLDLMTLFTGGQSYLKAAVYAEVGGLISALIAAVPGIIDYYCTVPPDSSAKRRATKHGMINGIMVMLFMMALLLRLKSDISLPVLIGMEAIGIMLIGVAGWLGGTLVVRNQIGVDHRYANAGKWQEETIETKAEKIELKDIDVLKLNQMKLLRINEKRIVIARTETGIVAFDDHCSHRGASLADGVMICETVQCPWHGSQFNVKNGEVKAGPAKQAIGTYRIESGNQKYYLLFK